MFPTITRDELTTLQVNLGYRCNQVCKHCHVDAGPHRTEKMSDQNISLIPKVITKYSIKTLDITGGAPEMHPRFKELIRMCFSPDIEIIDRCNLTILLEDGYNDLVRFLSEHNVTVVASLPCYQKDNVDLQRGYGVFEKSIMALKLLNEHGYGNSDSSLRLHLIYNPIGDDLPPSQKELELAYKQELFKHYGIVFNNLMTITNMPIKRFANSLKANGKLEGYLKKLKSYHNQDNLKNVMCRTLINVNWDGKLFDCDFNQQLDMGINSNINTMTELLDSGFDLFDNKIEVADHCYGCTAGNGSSCSGSLI